MSRHSGSLTPFLAGGGGEGVFQGALIRVSDTSTKVFKLVSGLSLGIYGGNFFARFSKFHF